MKRLKKIVTILLVLCCVIKTMPVQAAEYTKEDALLYIDGENCYEGMGKPYSEGYIPKIEEGKAFLVVPFLSSEKLEKDTVRVSLNLGDTENTPFVYKNYVKNVMLSEVEVNEKKEKIQAYVTLFELELKEDRKNGDYPVLLTAEAKTVSGTPVKKEQTIYVTVADGTNVDKDPADDSGDNNGNGPPADMVPDSGSDNIINDSVSMPDGGSGVTTDTSQIPKFAPKVIVKSCAFSKQPIVAGDEVAVTITLLNTSRQSAVRNMTVMIGGQGEYFSLLNETDTVYIDSMGTETTKEITYNYRVQEAAPQAQYSLDLTIDYADSEGNTCTAAGKVNIPVTQKVQLQFDAPALSPEMEVADVVNIQVQAMNLGRSKAYNVRAVLEGDGFLPDGTMFIGDLEPGTTGTGTTRLSITGLREGDSSYGAAKGIVTFYYEDESGQEYSEVKEVSTQIKSPFTEETNAEPEQTGQWWAIMGGIGAVLCVIIGGIVIHRIKQRKQEDEMVE